MSDRTAEVEAALERVIEAARTHLAVVAGRDGAPDDDAVWRAYVALNNAAYDYDRLLSSLYDEVTPFDVEKIVDESPDGGFATTLGSTPLSPAEDDPHPRVVSVRQRRDYRVPSVAALLRLVREVRPESGQGEEPVGSVGEAIIELLEAGDGSLSMLDVPELEPLDGVVMVAEVDVALSAEVLDESGADEPFRLAPGETVLARLHEHPPTEEE
ncbi:MAG: hypothetical protein IRY85_17135 [Micromonosporaceae bacterium]|nr:hypothetical protein [Micromonosporaceae bacterium]